MSRLPTPSKKNLFLTSALLCSALGLSTQANAQQSGAVLDEIIVTSQVRQESLQDVPVSVVAVSGDFLRETNVARLEDLRTIILSKVL